MVQGSLETCSNKLKCELKKKYKIKAKGFSTVTDEIKRHISQILKLKRCKSRVKQYQQKRTFKNKEKALHEELEGKMRQGQVKPYAEEESIKFWSELRDNSVDHDKNAEWIMTVEKELECVTEHGNINIIKEYVFMHLRKMSNWKAPSLDGLHGLWLKKLTSLPQEMEKHRDDFIQRGDVPNWMVEYRTVLIQKDARKGNAVGNYRPIACLNLLWKLIAGIINEKYYHLNQQNLLPQKCCRRKARGTKDQLLINKVVFRNSRRRKTKLNVVWIDFRKAYDMVRHNYILKTLELVGTARKSIELLKRSMQS